jgi:4'-phosphopantetheinyl transferase EntD
MNRDEQIGQRIYHVDRVELALHADHENLSGIFLDDVEHAVSAPIRRPVLDEIIGPDVVRSFQAQAHA